MGEQPIFTTKAHVFQIDPTTKKKWLPASSTAINVSYYYDSSRNTYRIISVEGSKAVINSTITPNMTFTKTSVKFGQWTDSRANTVYGLGFSSEADLTKFVEKFKEIKELCRNTPGGAKPASTGPAQTNGTSPIPEISQLEINTATTTTNSSSISQSHSPISSPKPSTNATPDTPVSLESRNHSNTNTSLPGSQVVEQLKYENDRLKIALAQSSANAKKWEIELQTLKNNNARLTTALQESTANVEEWKKQLALYKEESARMKKKFLDADKGVSGGGGSELLQRQLGDMRDKVTELEKTNAQKQEEISQLHSRLEDSKSLESRIEHLTDRIQTLERDKELLTKQTQTLKEQADGAQTSQARDKQQLRLVQEQIGSRVNELYGLSDKLAEMLH